MAASFFGGGGEGRANFAVSRHILLQEAVVQETQKCVWGGGGGGR